MDFNRRKWKVVVERVTAIAMSNHLDKFEPGDVCFAVVKRQKGNGTESMVGSWTVIRPISKDEDPWYNVNDPVLQDLKHKSCMNCGYLDTIKYVRRSEKCLDCSGEINRLYEK